ncbi:MAG: hypothetical protein JSW60_09175 [Thermoplasmatales archaeon]|nr:MAG: hypothetical protein JSW60_09175 [Thermoplasmatales archaeon]
MDREQMQKFLFIVFLVIFVATCFMVLFGLYKAWDTGEKLPYLEHLIAITIGEVALAIVGLWKDLFGLKIVDTKTYKSKDDVANFMENFIKNGGPIDIFARELEWVKNYPKVKETLITQADGGSEINIFIPKMNPTAEDLRKNNIRVIETKTPISARFTFIKRDSAGSEKLAIVIPDYPKPGIFTIHQFFDTRNPQVIAASKHLIKLSLEHYKK